MVDGKDLVFSETGRVDLDLDPKSKIKTEKELTLEELRDEVRRMSVEVFALRDQLIEDKRHREKWTGYRRITMSSPRALDDA